MPYKGTPDLCSLLLEWRIQDIEAVWTSLDYTWKGKADKGCLCTENLDKKKSKKNKKKTKWGQKEG